MHNPRLAGSIENGLGVARDYKRAMEWYLMSAEGNDLTAQTGLGRLFEAGGFGVQRDYGKAMEWSRTAADRDFSPAQYQVAWLYENGLGVPKDLEQAKKWYQKSVKSNQWDQRAKDGLSRVEAAQRSASGWRRWFS